MPFDALLLRKLQHMWERDLVGTRFEHGSGTSSRITLYGTTEQGASVRLLIVLEPGMARVHRVDRLPPAPKSQARSPFLERLLPFTLVGIEVPRWERAMHWRIATQDVLGDTLSQVLVIELAGHLTNLVWLDDTGTVLDAWRRVPPGHRGRSLWPLVPYQPPPPPPSPFPPWLTGLAMDDAAKDALWDSALTGRVFPGALGAPEDVWVLPVAGRASIPLPDAELEATVARIWAEHESAVRYRALALAAQGRLGERLCHLDDRLREYAVWRDEDPERWRRVGDLWLAYQRQFTSDNRTYLAEDYGAPGEHVTLALPDGSTPVAEAEKAYRRYQKSLARQHAAVRLAEAVHQERENIEQQLNRISALLANPDPTAIAWLQGTAPRRPSGNNSSAAEPYRRFRSSGGFEIWVGRNAAENDQLTLRVARPDDLWFHVKQVPGSHVLLRTQKTDPNLEDLLDAAHLAAFYSGAGQSSMIPVDYTRRKHVKRLRHGHPGQVTYRQEKTLYVTPEPTRLERLGAVKSRLAEESDV